FDRAEAGRMLAGLGNRVFLMRNAHESAPVLFQTRWALSYLRGPMTMPQITGLAVRSASALVSEPVENAAVPVAHSTAETAAAPATRERAVLPHVTEFFMRPARSGGKILYRPRLVGFCKLHVVDAKHGIDTWLRRTVLAPFADSDGTVNWEEAETLEVTAEDFDRQPLPDAVFAELPAQTLAAARYSVWGKEMAAALYQTFTLELFAVPALKLVSVPGESEETFRSRAAQRLREQRDQAMAKLKARYAPKVQSLTDQIRRAEERLNREKAQAGQQRMSTVISFGATLLGAFMGRGARSVGTVGRAATAMKSASRIGKEAGDVARAVAGMEVLQARLSELEAAFEREIADMDQPLTPETVEIDRKPLRPRKTDLSVGTLGICWLPWRRAADGVVEPA
ncbi:MAG: hypothetical protein PHU80_08815, partial [Kiritimatiellae bacterium]|nr:hypothetical protein [Kiritimatiellia bacterium]